MQIAAKVILFSFPKVLLFCAAIANVLFFASLRLPRSNISFPAYTPWYESSEFSTVYIILFATFALLFNKRFTILTAWLLSGYILVPGIVQLFLRDITIRERWIMLQRLELNPLAQLEAQWVFAGIVFVVASGYLIYELWSKRSISEAQVADAADSVGSS